MGIYGTSFSKIDVNILHTNLKYSWVTTGLHNRSKIFEKHVSTVWK